MSSWFIRRANITAGGGPEPTPYTDLAYIESSNTQYINTGYVVTENDVIEVDYELQDLSQGSDKFIIGATGGSYGLWVENYTSSNTWYFRFGHSSSVNKAFGNLSSGTFVIKKGLFTVGGVGTALPYSGMPTGNLILFGRISTSNTFKGCYIRLSEVRIKNNGIMIHQYVPKKRNSDDEVGMYDLVSDIFLTNAGSGSFGYGEL